MIHLLDGEKLHCSGCNEAMDEKTFKVLVMGRGATGAAVYFFYCIPCRQKRPDRANQEVASGW